MIHMKYQALFSQKNINKKHPQQKLLSAAVKISTFRVNVLLFKEQQSKTET